MSQQRLGLARSLRRMLAGILVATGSSLALLPVAASAAELRYGTRGEASSLDPHFHAVLRNEEVAAHIFDRLLGTDDKQQLVPALATSWRAIDDTTWQLDLRRDVRWHDGSPFTAKDVLFTVKRAADVPGSPAGYAVYLKGRSFSAPDDFTIVVKTAKPDPLVPQELSRVFVVSAKHGEGATTADYNAGKAAIGTGPYRFVERVPGDRVVLAANTDYWGGKPAWDRITFKPINTDLSRIAALASGTVDIIDQVATADVQRLKRDPALFVSQHAAAQVYYLYLDSSRAESPFVKGIDGKPLSPSPLLDARVRRAISLAINRDAIVERVMDGAAVPAGQYMPEGFFGFSPTIKTDPYDPARARQLLAEAGYPNGFQLVLHGPNGNYINDGKLMEAIAQMLTRAGIKAEPQPLPPSIYFTKAGNLEFSVGMSANSAWTGEASTALNGLLHTYDTARGLGPYNRARYSNPSLDALIQEARETVDDVKRRALYIKATDIAIAEMPYIPLLYPVNTWAMRKDLRFGGRSDGHMLANAIRPAP